MRRAPPRMKRLYVDRTGSQGETGVPLFDPDPEATMTKANSRRLNACAT